MFLKTAYADDDTITIKETEELPVESGSSIYSNFTSLIPMLLIFVVFYFFLIRPQEKRRREKEAIVKNIKKGEEVVTNSGIFGIIVKINDTDNTADLKIAENVQVKILKSAIIDITSRHKKQDNDKSKKDKGK